MNLIFAPFIVMYLLLLYFFRYFEVYTFFVRILMIRNIIRIQEPLDPGNINPLHSGSFVNLMSCITYSRSDSTLATNLLRNTSINSRKRRLRKYLGITPKLVFSNVP